MSIEIPRILCVDDEPNVLQAFKRQLRGKFDLEVSSDPVGALELISTKGPFSVVLTDMRMPGLDGVQFLNELEKRSSDSVRIMLSGNADRSTPMKAINEGHVFKFLSKPCSIEELENALQDAHNQYKIQKAEKDLLNNTLGGCIKLLTDALSLIAPDKFNLSLRARDIAAELLPRSGIKGAWEVNLAIMLSDIGLVTIPAELQLKSKTPDMQLTDTERQLLEKLPRTSADLLGNIPRCEKVSEIILYQAKNFDGSGFPADSKKGEQIPVGARFVKIIHALAKLESDGMGRAQAIARLLAASKIYDQNLLVRIIKEIRADKGAESPASYEIKIKDLCAGQILKSNITDKEGRLLIAQGATVTEMMITRLNNYAELVGVNEPILVHARIPGNSSEI